MLMSLNDCMAEIRNLEGIIDFDDCLYFSGYILEYLPGDFFCVNNSSTFLKKIENNDQSNESENEQQYPILYLSVFNLISSKHFMVFDIRGIKEFEELQVIDSYNIPLSQNSIETYIEYFELKSYLLTSLPNLKYQKIDKKTKLYSENQAEFINFVFLDNYESENCIKFVNMLLKRGIRNVSILKGGFSSISMDMPELLSSGNKSQPFGYYKKEVKRMKDEIKRFQD